MRSTSWTKNDGKENESAPLQSTHFSSRLPRFSAAFMPSHVPRKEERSRLVPRRAMVLGTRDLSSSITGRPVRKEMPKSKERVDFTYSRNWTGRGLSSP